MNSFVNWLVPFQGTFVQSSFPGGYPLAILTCQWKMHRVGSGEKKLGFPGQSQLDLSPPRIPVTNGGLLPFLASGKLRDS